MSFHINKIIYLIVFYSLFYFVEAVSDVLFGDYGFHGKLSFTWPKSPYPETHEPLFAYGYGLS